MGKSHYKIQFGGLSLGEHQFEFEVTQKFFEQFKDSEITKANVQVKANLIKQNTTLLTALRNLTQLYKTLQNFTTRFTKL
jgi:hypothetical protein